MCFQVSQAPSAQSVFETASDKHIYNNQGALAKLSHMKCLKQYCLLTKVPNKLPTSVRSLENTILTRVYECSCESQLVFSCIRFRGFHQVFHMFGKTNSRCSSAVGLWHCLHSKDLAISQPANHLPRKRGKGGLAMALGQAMSRRGKTRNQWKQGSRGAPKSWTSHF